MTDGHVTPEGVPLIAVQLAGQDWNAIIDTGFNGDIELPQDLRPHVNAQFVGRVESLLAGGQSIEEDAYLVDFPFAGQTIRVEATFAATAEILIGTHLLRDHYLHINFPAKTLTIE